MTNFFLHNSFNCGDVILTRALIDAIRNNFTGVKITLECVENSAYLWQDLKLPISLYQGQEYQGTESTPNCPVDATFVNMWFGIFDDILSLYGMTYQNNVHTFNRQMYQHNLNHQYLLPIPVYTPMITFLGQPEKEIEVRKNSILVENGEVFSRQNYFYLNEHLKQIVSDFPQLNFYCSGKPKFAAANIFDCSGMNLKELSQVGDKCIGLLMKGSAVNAASQTEINRYKPRCIIGWDLPMKLWDNLENPVVYAKNYAEVQKWLGKIVEDISLSTGEAKTGNLISMSGSKLQKELASKDNDNLQDKILIISHKEKQCGVHEYGINIAKALKKSAKYSFVYAECSSYEEFCDRVKEVRPSAIIYNYYSSTLPWVNKKILQSINVPHIGIIHEVTQGVADTANNGLFQYHIGPDPTLQLKNPIVFKSGRIVLSYTNNHKLPEIPTIGSFGFGLEGKGFEKVITTVQGEYDEAIIRLHIPFATFGDADGRQAMAIAQRCQQLIVKPGIKLSLSHDFLSQEQLLDFLAQNTLNVFFYDRHEHRGISSVIDHALAVKRPIAVTKSNMFRHILSAQPSICIEDSSLREIINNGIAPLVPFYNESSEANFIVDYEQILDRVLGKEQSQTPTLSLFKTPIGNYYLPADVEQDIIVNEMKAGRVFEPEIVEVAKQYITDGSTVLDVGANFGQMALLFSQFVGEKGRILAFEADHFTFSVLEKNIAANSRTNIMPISKAVYDKSGEVMFYPVPDFKRFSSYGSYGLDPNAREGRKVETIAIDSLNIQSPISFMKVDVQGSDLFVLRGAVETIRRHQMPIIFEYEEQFQEEFKTSWNDYLKLIELIDYKIERVINNMNYLIVPNKKKSLTVGILNVTSFNRILDDAARKQYESVINQLFVLVPEMMARKIPEANIQQAFILDTVQKFASQLVKPKILCVGSYEDSAAGALKQLGYGMEEIDPAINCDLNAYFHKPSTIKGSYDIIFSTSVLEHVQNDELFMTQIAELLAPGGTAILTCDYNDQYKPGDRIPSVDFRLYTQKDFRQRILPLLKNCVFPDVPQWDCPNPDFLYEGCRYTFATFVFQKNKL